jgi:hypothetical protein
MLICSVEPCFSQLIREDEMPKKPPEIIFEVQKTIRKVNFVGKVNKAKPGSPKVQAKLDFNNKKVEVTTTEEGIKSGIEVAFRFLKRLGS